METEYTKGFSAGIAWREAEIIKLIQEDIGKWGDVNVTSVIALIKGEK